MKIKCGTDIIEVSRIKESIEKLGDKFLNKIYTQKEIEYCLSKNNMKYQHFAARFAAKEAIFKAISSLLKNKYEITWKDVEVLNDENGRPYVHFLNNNYNIEQIDISISHLKEYAIATCIVEI
jgi:holo-[acyl-carrier-protein] synthase